MRRRVIEEIMLFILLFVAFVVVPFGAIAWWIVFGY